MSARNSTSPRKRLFAKARSKARTRYHGYWGTWRGTRRYPNIALSGTGIRSYPGGATKGKGSWCHRPRSLRHHNNIWGGSWEKVHNVKIFNFCFFADSYGGFNEETSVENRLKKISRHHKVTALFVTRVYMRIYDTSWLWSRFSPLCGCGRCVPFRMSRPIWYARRHLSRYHSNPTIDTLPDPFLWNLFTLGLWVLLSAICLRKTKTPRKRVFRQSKSHHSMMAEHKLGFSAIVLSTCPLLPLFHLWAKIRTSEPRLPSCISEHQPCLSSSWQRTCQPSSL